MVVVVDVLGDLPGSEAHGKLTHACRFLHQEYRPSTPFFAWEPLFLIQRLTISGFFAFIPYRFVRLCCALFFTVCYMVVLLLATPFKRESLNYAAAGAQFALVWIFVGTMAIKVYDDLATHHGLDAARTASLRIFPRLQSASTCPGSRARARS